MFATIGFWIRTLWTPRSTPVCKLGGPCGVTFGWYCPGWHYCAKDL